MIFSQKTAEKYRQYINEQKKKLITLEKGQPPTTVVEDRVLPLNDGGEGGTTDKLRKDDNHWTSVEKGHQLNI